MENKQLREKNIKTAIILAEFILLPIHLKLNVLPNPQIITGFMADEKGSIEWEANSWPIEILNSDYGEEKIHISDHLLDSIVLLAQEIAFRTYEKLLGKEKADSMANYIYGNTNIWSEKLQELGN
ncbi:hypothetical protein HXX01_02360 [Candidatus Nomurabacteria bacterium]|nr:hypothetical protein [Candidatus Nomurabacteria bacterium]